MDLRIRVGELKTPQDILRLVSAISEIADELDTLITTTSPNGNISARQGKIALYNNSGTYTTWINEDGDKTWHQISAE